MYDEALTLTSCTSRLTYSIEDKTYLSFKHRDRGVNTHQSLVGREFLYACQWSRSSGANSHLEARCLRTGKMMYCKPSRENPLNTWLLLPTAHKEYIGITDKKYLTCKQPLTIIDGSTGCVLQELELQHGCFTFMVKPESNRFVVMCHFDMPGGDMRTYLEVFELQDLGLFARVRYQSFRVNHDLRCLEYQWAFTCYPWPIQLVGSFMATDGGTGALNWKPRTVHTLEQAGDHDCRSIGQEDPEAKTLVVDLKQEVSGLSAADGGEIAVHDIGVRSSTRGGKPGHVDFGSSSGTAQYRFADGRFLIVEHWTGTTHLVCFGADW